METDDAEAALPSGGDTPQNGLSTAPQAVVMRHHMPQIPMMSHNPKIAQSKRAVNENEAQAETMVNIVPNEALEAPKPPPPPSEEAKEEAPVTVSIPNGMSNPTSPQSDDKQGSVSPSGTPIKLKIRRSLAEHGETLLTSSVTLGDTEVFHDDPQSSADVPTPQEKPASEKTKAKKGPKKGSKKSEGKSESQASVSDTKAVPETKWLVGDMVWSKVSGHPWWPCMVSYDPILSVYTRMKGTTPVKSFRLYHMQFFGEATERGWVAEQSTMEFKGLEDYKKVVEETLAKCPNKTQRSKMAQKYEPSARRKAAWDYAIVEAEDALKMNRVERKQRYTFEYKLPKSKKKEGAASQPDKQPADNKDTPKNRGRKRKNDADKDDDQPARKSQPTPKRSPKKSADTNKGQFSVFCQKRRDQAKEENPEMEEGEIDELLTNEWNSMNEKQRARYKSRSEAGFSSDGQESSAPVVKTKSGRVRKLSKKMYEGTTTEDDEEEVQPPPKKRQRKSKGSVSKSSIDDVIDSVIAGATPTAGKKRGRKSRQSQEEPMDVADEAASDTSSKSNGKKAKADNEYELEIFKLTDACQAKRENICQICEQALPADMLQCEGPCNASFHLNCLGLTTTPSEFKCDECMTGVHTCFVCKETSSSLKRCGVPSCGKFYHEPCISKYPLTRVDGKALYCPLHMCGTCAAGNPKNTKATKGRLLRCVRCPTAYHVGDFCVAAGSIAVGGTNIVCSKHFQPVKTHAHHAHVNVGWCFICNKGGTLLCCESCPSAFHAECLKIDFPDGSWFCTDCRNGKKPLYGDIIWVKLGNYRWWPGEVCHPENVPHNIQEKTHQVGEFPVRFFGSHDYFWTHQARVFSFQEGDKGSTESATSKGIAKVFKLGVKEATEAYKVWKSMKDGRIMQELEKSDKKPAPFRFTKVNVPYGNVVLNKPDPLTIPRCECKPTQEQPCASDNDCLNRMLMYECHPATCPSGDKCQNQCFTKRQYPESEPFKTKDRGWGLRTKVNIKKGQFVNEYCGELVDEEECRNRIVKAHDTDIHNFYMLTIDKNLIIDAGPKGNWSRFMNHCCQPNLETQKWTVNGNIRVGLFAMDDIPAGTELTFNYNLDCLGNDKKACHCGAPNCSGYLGVRPKTAAAAAREMKLKEGVIKKKKKKKSKPNVKKEHEDYCFRCGDGGELVMCDRTKCPKAYHIQCLKLTKPPYGKWECPWHHCDECGKSATLKCVECPNSFCGNHEEGNIVTSRDSLYCTEHEDLIKALESGTMKRQKKVIEYSSSADSSAPTSETEDSTTQNEASDSSSKDKKTLTNSVKKTSKPNKKDAKKVVKKESSSASSKKSKATVKKTKVNGDSIIKKKSSGKKSSNLVPQQMQNEVKVDNETFTLPALTDFDNDQTDDELGDLVIDIK